MRRSRRTARRQRHRNPGDDRVDGGRPRYATLTYRIVSGPAHGTLGPITGNYVTYTPAPGYSGADLHLQRQRRRARLEHRDRNDCRHTRASDDDRHANNPDPHGQWAGDARRGRICLSHRRAGSVDRHAGGGRHLHRLAGGRPVRRFRQPARPATHARPYRAGDLRAANHVHRCRRSNLYAEAIARLAALNVLRGYGEAAPAQRPGAARPDGGADRPRDGLGHRSLPAGFTDRCDPRASVH